MRLELLQTLCVTHVLGRQGPGRPHAEPGRNPLACARVNGPCTDRLVPNRAFYAGVEPDVVESPEPVVRVVGVVQNFGLRGVFLRRMPFLLQVLGELIRVLQARHVAACSGVAIPVSCSVDIAATLEGLCRKAECAQLVEQVKQAPITTRSICPAEVGLFPRLSVPPTGCRSLRRFVSASTCRSDRFEFCMFPAPWQRRPHTISASDIA